MNGTGGIVVEDVTVGWVILNVSNDNADSSTELALNEVSNLYHVVSMFCGYTIM